MDLRNVKDFKLNKVIVHILDKTKEPTLSDFELDLNEKTTILFQKHILKSINEEYTRVAYFTGEVNVVRDNLINIFSDDSNFIQCSKEIAEHLFMAMKSKSSSSSAYFAVCDYETINGKNIALLKLDFNENYQSKVEEIGDKKKIKFVEIDNIVPSHKQKLQKCVFIPSVLKKDSTEIILLDKQIKRNESTSLVADFFSGTFLNCCLKNTKKDATRTFKKEVEKFIKDNISDEKESINLKKSLFVTLKSAARINVLEFAETYFSNNQEIKEKFLATMSENVKDFTIDVDEGWIKDKMDKVVYKTDVGINIEINTDDMTKKDHFDIKETGNGDCNIIIRNVRIKDIYS